MDSEEGGTGSLRGGIAMFETIGKMGQIVGEVEEQKDQGSRGQLLRGLQASD